jgi:hypothetical protein
MAGSTNFRSGAFVAYEPDDPATVSRFIPFRFNPETLVRDVSVEQGEGGGAPSGAAAKAGADAASEQGADANSGTLKESLSVLVRLDFADRDQTAANLPPEFGIAPEIAALEDLLYPAEAPSDAPADGSEPVKARAKRPTILFVWGEKRVLPVRITSMNISETLFNARLYPIRAEIEVGLEVLSETDARDNTRVRSALDFTGSNRRDLARLYLDNTASQGTNVSLP